jgi:hypothetical protein
MTTCGVLQNEDANRNLVVIELHSGSKKKYNFPPTPHGGGYDDMVVKNGEVFITASNPNLGTLGNNVPRPGARFALRQKLDA